MFRKTATFIAFAAACVAGPALAATPLNTWNDDTIERVETLDIRGVDFNNPSDVKKLHTRLRYAAARVCASDGSDTQCRKEALADAVRQVNQPQLSALDDETNGRDTRLAWNQAGR